MKMETRADERARERRKKNTRSSLRTIGGAVVLALTIRIVFFEPFEIDGPSMEPTLLNGDRVVVAKFMYGLHLPFMTDSIVQWSAPNRGDIVIVHNAEDHVDVVKRVIGVAGDTIAIRGDVIYLDGEPVGRRELGPCLESDELDSTPGCKRVEETLAGLSYRTSHSSESASFDLEATRIPEGHVFLMGDHRDRSKDSRYYGPVPLTRVKGRALAIYWSSDKQTRWDRMFQGVR